jgi:hypothetical protein
MGEMSICGKAGKRPEYRGQRKEGGRTIQQYNIGPPLPSHTTPTSLAASSGL